MYSQEEIHDLIVKLKDYYPHRAEEASNILLQEYQFPIQLAAAIMNIIKILSQKNDCFKWPSFDVSYQPFYVN